MPILPARPVSPRLLILPHRQPAPRTQCDGCKGGGEINGIPCRSRGGRGWHDATSPARARKTTDDADAY